LGGDWSFTSFVVDETFFGDAALIGLAQLGHSSDSE